MCVFVLCFVVLFRIVICSCVLWVCFVMVFCAGILWLCFVWMSGGILWGVGGGFGVFYGCVLWVVL